MSWFSRQSDEDKGESVYSYEPANTVDADESFEDECARRMREIHEEVEYSAAMNHLEHQKRYDARRERTDAFWEERWRRLGWND